MLKHRLHDATLQKIVEIIVKTVDPNKVILFGSRARGNYSEISDYDILILKDSAENERAITSQVYKELFNQHVDREVDLMPQPLKKWRSINVQQDISIKRFLKKVLYYMNDSVEKWLERAESSYQLGIVRKTEGMYYEDLCYQLQQACEKYLRH